MNKLNKQWFMKYLFFINPIFEMSQGDLKLLKQSNFCPREGSVRPSLTTPAVPEQSKRSAGVNDPGTLYPVHRYLGSQAMTVIFYLFHRAWSAVRR